MQVEQEFLKYNVMARFMYKLCSKSGFNYLETVYSKPETKAMKKRAKQIYREILGRTPGIGKHSAMLLMPVALLSIYQAAEGRMEESVFAGMTESVARTPLFLKMAAGRKLFTEKFHEKTHKNAALSQTSPYKMNWRFTHKVIGPDEYLTTYTRCGVCEVAKQEDCFDLAKYFCRIDFITYELMGAILDRTKTLADGDDVCDFHVIRKQ